MFVEKETANSYSIEALKSFLEQNKKQIQELEENNVLLSKAIKEKEENLINICQIKCFLKNGFVAMSEDGFWYWFEEKPVLENKTWIAAKGSVRRLDMFNIQKEDFSKSLYSCGLSR